MSIPAWFPPDRICNEKIKGDPDIDGLGVLSSFVVISWITIVVAGVSALHDLVESYKDPSKRYIIRTSKKHARHNEDAISQVELDMLPFSLFSRKCSKFLGILCDLQVITGIGIVIAGWAQMPAISYFHEELVMCYWNLTLDSFWAGRADYMGIYSKGDPLRLLIRRVAILCSCVLGLSFQGFIFVREYWTWDDDEGPCFRYEDGTSPIPWMAGISLFSIALISLIFPWTRKYLGQLFDKIEITNGKLNDLYKRAKEELAPKVLHQRQWTFSRLLKLLWWGCLVVCRVLWYALIVWLDIWSYGDTFWPISWFFYVLFNIWNTFDVVSLWINNQVNLVDQEQHLGFGQVLPLVLIASIIFQGIDIYREKDVEYAKRFRDLEAKQQVTELYVTFTG